MFKNGKLVGLTLVSGFLLNSCSLIANADKKEKIRLPFINYARKGTDIVPKDVEDAVGDARFYFEKGYILEANSSKEKAESLVRKYNLDIFLPWQDLTPYEALFDLSYCEDLDERHSYIYAVKSIPKEMERIIAEENWYTNKISDMRSNLRKGVFEEGEDYDKRKLVILFKERDLVRKKLALCVAKYGIELKKRFIDVGQEENINSDSTEKNASSASKEEKEQNTQSDTSKKKSNQEQQSLVRTDAVSNESWGFLDIVFGIKDKVKSLLVWNEKEREFVSKEEDLKREAKRQETEFSLSLLVKRFLDMVRDEGKVEVKSENVQNEKTTSNLLETTNLLTDGNIESN